jgi:TRAP-type C4-dicarboxylate transport system substrate-binding protein
MNKWLGVIFHASSMIWHASSAAERKAFRDVALAATAAGRRVGGLRDKVYTEKMIYIRMSYIHNSDEDPAWRRSEMDRVLDCFLESLPMDISSAHDKSRNWWEEQPNGVIKSLPP